MYERCPKWVKPFYCYLIYDKNINLGPYWQKAIAYFPPHPAHPLAILRPNNVLCVYSDSASLLHIIPKGH